MLSSREILNKKFERASFGGYRNEDVDNFLNEIARNMEELEEQNSVLTKKLEVLAEKLEEYRGDEESLRAALLGAQKLGDSVVRDSKNKAEIIMRDATIKAERIINTAHEQVEKEKMIYIKLQKDVAAFRNKLMAIYRQHLELINNLPVGESEKEASAPAPSASQQRSHPEQEPEASHSRPLQEEQPRDRDEEIEMPAPAASRAQDADEDAFEEPSARQRKFIPVPAREEPPQPRAAKYSEYYEDLDEDQPEPAPQQANIRKSKFGTLKFGAGYDLKRE